MASLFERALRTANAHPGPMLAAGCAAMAWPAARLAQDWRADALGINGLETLIHTTGACSFVLLLGAMTLGPARRALVHLSILYQAGYGKRLSDWNWLLRLRRPVGIASFLYGFVHAALYAWLGLGLDWREGCAELVAKPFLATGAVALVLLAPLAITSTDGWVRRLRQKWKLLHMLVYPTAGLGLMHVILLAKPGMPPPYDYGAVLMVLLGYRVLQRRALDLPPQERANATVPERPAQPAQPAPGEAQAEAQVEAHDKAPSPRSHSIHLLGKEYS